MEVYDRQWSYGKQQEVTDAIDTVRTDSSPVSIAHGMDSARLQEERIRALEQENAMLRASRGGSRGTSADDHRPPDLVNTRFPSRGSVGSNPPPFPFAKAAHLAVAMKAKEHRQEENGHTYRQAFRQFALLSINPFNISASVTDDRVVQGGPKYMDPFQVHSPDVMDMFPTQRRSLETDSLFDAAALSSFCFPNGVRVRLVPKSALEGARRKGWTGKNGDVYRVLVFTDGAGVSSQGVAITIQEEVHTPAVVDHFVTKRQRRRAATTLARWWRKCQQKLIENSRMRRTSLRQFFHETDDMSHASSRRRPSITAFLGNRGDNRGDRSDDESMSQMSIFSKNAFRASFCRQDPAPVPSVIGSDPDPKDAESACTEDDMQYIDSEFCDNASGNDARSGDGRRGSATRRGSAKRRGSATRRGSGGTRGSGAARGPAPRRGSDGGLSPEEQARNTERRSRDTRRRSSDAGVSSRRSAAEKSGSREQERASRDGRGARRPSIVEMADRIRSRSVNANKQRTSNSSSGKSSKKKKKHSSKSDSGKERSPKKKGGVAGILEDFLRTSAIPKYDSKVDTGVWKSAKLRFRKKTNQYMVVVQHGPLAGNTTLSKGSKHVFSYDYTHLFEQERSRLASMLANVDIPAPKKMETDQPFRVSEICFQEVVGDADAPIVSNEIITPCLQPSKKTGKRAMESYKVMKACEKAGEVCLMEKCYVLMGCKPSELCLVFLALEQLIDAERKLELTNCQSERSFDSGKGRGNYMRSLSDVSNETRGSSSSKANAEAKRHSRLASIQTLAFLSSAHEAISYPESERDHMHQERPTFDFKLPFRNSPNIRLPLPLPQVSGEWGLGRLLVKIGPGHLIKLLKLLLLERSVLVLGLNSEEVTVCTCTLLELLKPYEWASTFLPQLPIAMMDLIHSPVPFLVGMSVDCVDDLETIERDTRVADALQEGMAVLNIHTRAVVTGPFAEETFVGIPSSKREKLDLLQNRLTRLLKDPNSSFESLRTFVRKGPSQSESLTFLFIRRIISQYMTDLAGDIASEKYAWKRYGTEERNEGFSFHPALYYEQLFAELEFRREMAHTQMFAGFVHARRNEDNYCDEPHKRNVGRFIAAWAQERWQRKKQERELLQ